MESGDEANFESIPLERKVSRFLATRRKILKAKKDLKELEDSLETMKKHPDLMNIIGNIDRADLKRTDPESFRRKESRKKKQRAKKKRKLEEEEEEDEEDEVLPMKEGDGTSMRSGSPLPPEALRGALIPRKKGKARSLADQEKKDTKVAFQL